MHPSQSLELVLQLAERERDAAQAASRRADEALAAAEAQAAQLDHYRHEYLQRWGAQFRFGGSGPEVLHCYQGFMARLQEAIAQQSRLQAQAARQQAQARAALLQCETRLASVQRLLQKRRSEALALVQRREQKLSDEQAGVLALRRRIAQAEAEAVLERFAAPLE